MKCFIFTIVNLSMDVKWEFVTITLKGVNNMIRHIQKYLYPVVFSLLITFFPFVSPVQDFSFSYPKEEVREEVRLEQESLSYISYSVCNAATKNVKSSNKNKAPKREASFLSKAAGFVIGGTICEILISIACAISVAVFSSSLESETCEPPWVRIGILTGILYFIGRCIVTGLIVNLMTVTANVMGFIRWFDYACYAIMLYTLIGNFKYGLSVFGGYILGIIFMEMFFG